MMSKIAGKTRHTVRYAASGVRPTFHREGAQVSKPRLTRDLGRAVQVRAKFHSLYQPEDSGPHVSKVMTYHPELRDAEGWRCCVIEPDEFRRLRSTMAQIHPDFTYLEGLLEVAWRVMVVDYVRKSAGTFGNEAVLACEDAPDVRRSVPLPPLRQRVSEALLRVSMGVET